MADELNATIAGLNDLNKTARFSAIEFQGLTKSLIKMADSTSRAGKKWTILSRFLSGTPLWKVQNYVRATIGVFAELESSSQEVMKAQEEQNKTFMESIKNYDTLKKQVKDTNFLMKDLGKTNSKITKMVDDYTSALDRQKNAQKILARVNRDVGNPNFEENLEMAESVLEAIDKEVEKRKEQLDIVKQQKKIFEDSLEDNITYQKILLATGNAEKARFVAVSEYNKQFKLETKRRKVIEKQVKDAYAFDESRLKTAKNLAKFDAKRMGLNKKDTKFFLKMKKDEEKKQMKKDQKKVEKEGFTGFMKSVSDTVPNTAKALKPLLNIGAPVLGIFKLAKASTGMGKDARKFRTRMYKLGQRTMKVLDFFFKYMMLGIIVAGAILIGMKYFQELYGLLSEMGVIDRIKDLGKDLMSILGDVFSVVDAFMKGDYEKIVPLLGKIFDKAVLFLLKTLGVLLDVGFLALVAGFKLVGDFIVKMFTDEAFKNRVLKGLKVLLLFVAGFIVLKFIIAQLILLAGIAALPVALGIVVLAAGFTIAKYFGDKLREKFGKQANRIIEGVWKMVNFLKGVRDKVSEFGKKLRDMPFFANGGVSSGGLAVVGERGPELVNLPAGARVNSNRESRKMAGGTTNNINITINARDTSDQELRRIADKIGQMVNTKINRTTSSRTFGG
jgi:hypothetical protein